MTQLIKKRISTLRVFDKFYFQDENFLSKHLNGQYAALEGHNLFLVCKMACDEDPTYTEVISLIEPHGGWNQPDLKTVEMPMERQLFPSSAVVLVEKRDPSPGAELLDAIAKTNESTPSEVASTLVDLGNYQMACFEKQLDRELDAMFQLQGEELQRRLEAGESLEDIIDDFLEDLEEEDDDGSL